MGEGDEGGDEGGDVDKDEYSEVDGDVVGEGKASDSEIEGEVEVVEARGRLRHLSRITLQCEGRVVVAATVVARARPRGVMGAVNSA